MLRIAQPQASATEEQAGSGTGRPEDHQHEGEQPAAACFDTGIGWRKTRAQAKALAENTNGASVMARAMKTWRERSAAMLNCQKLITHTTINATVNAAIATLKPLPLTEIRPVRS